MPGPFHFAWVEPEDNVFAISAHAVDDEEIVGFDFSHKEGGFASLVLQIRNPRVGMLGPGRARWCWWSFDTQGSGGVVPLFFGRLLGIPTDFTADACTLEFIARPEDFDAQKIALAATLKVDPYWDPIFISEDERENPDSVLESRAESWHIDPVTHVVSVSDQAVGEDGTLSFGMDDFVGESLTPNLAQAPLRKVRVEAEVRWTQAAQGEFNIKNQLLNAFEDAGSDGNLVSSYTGDGLANDWPKEGGSIGGGWGFGPCSMEQVDGILFTPVYFLAYSQFISVYKGYDGDWGGYQGSIRVLAQLYHHRPTLNIRYDAKRERVERLTFDLEADVQALLTEPGEDEAHTISVASASVAEPADPINSDNPTGMPIGDVRRRAYFTTDRGRRSVEYLLALARAELLRRARAVEISIQIPFTSALGLSLRKNAVITDTRLPGGQAAGKIVGYRLAWAGGDAAFAGELTIGCMIGQGNTVSAIPGTPVYVEEGVLEAGIQAYAGEFIMPFPGEVRYGDYSEEPNDDGLDFFQLEADDVINSLTVTNGPDDQENVMDQFWLDAAGMLAALKANYTTVTLNLKSVTGGPYTTEYEVPVSDLMVPKHINMEAV